MATYWQIEDWVQQRYGFVPSSGWIAHVKELHGLPVQRASSGRRLWWSDPCPPDRLPAIEAAFRHFGMLGDDAP
jgi:hypothetical protein